MKNRYKLFILFWMFASCNTLKTPIESIEECFNINEYKYIYNYVLNDLIISPVRFDVNPLLCSDFNEKEAMVVVSKASSPEKFTRWICDIIFHTPDNYDFIVPKGDIESLLPEVLNGNLTVKITKLTDREKELLSNSNSVMLIQFSEIIQAENKYYIIVSYARKYIEIDDTYGETRMFEFQKCPNGIILFSKSYESIGRNEGKPMYFTYDVNKHSCNCE